MFFGFGPLYTFLIILGVLLVSGIKIRLADPVPQKDGYSGDLARKTYQSGKEI